MSAQTAPYFEPPIKKCCCCSLETGSKIIGFLQVIIYGLTFVMKLLIADIYLFPLVEYTEDYEDYLMFLSEFSLELSLTLLNLFNALFAIYLLLGIYKKKPSHILIWLWVETAFLIMEVVLILHNVIVLTVLDHFTEGFFPDIIVASWLIYILAVVYSYYIELQSTISEENSI